MTTLLLSGTLSNPPFEKGLQRKIRQKAKTQPTRKPLFKMASKAYCEQVGV